MFTIQESYRMTTELSAEQWNVIDEDLLNHARIAAIKLFRDYTGASLRDAMNAIHIREQHLRSQYPEQFPRPNNTPQDILERFRALTSRPSVIEALWDGDTAGWFLILSAIYEPVDPDRPEESTYQLAVLRGDGGDIRLFNQEIPPWPEAETARTVGSIIEHDYHIPFYFPSPDYPEDDCPRWWQRHRGTPCQRCGILLLQDREPCPWRGMCYQCYLALERQRQTAETET
jgi:hypothetical protein